MGARSYRDGHRVAGEGVRTIDILLAGCGRWGARILADLVALEARVRVADPSADARRAALAAGAVGVATDVETFANFDGAIVATPTRLHAEVIERLAPRGTPIFCEKPLTAEAASARRLADALDGRLWVMEKWRWHPGVEAIAAIAREERLGIVRALTTRRLQPSISGYDVDPVWVLAPHELSIASEILGGLPRLVRASATFEKGEVVGFSAEGESPCRYAFEISVRAPERLREIELVAEAGTVRWTSADEHAIRLGDRREAVAAEPPLRREIAAILAFLGGGPAPKGSLRESAAAVAALEDARAAAGVTSSGREAP